MRAPSWLPSIVLNRLSMALFNEARYRGAPRAARTHIEPLGSFFHPLDFVADWNRIYGPGGLLQYQIAVPDTGSTVVRRAIELLSNHRCGSFLGVLKRFGAANPGPLSFPRPGWTLAVDLPARPGRGVGGLLDRLDEVVADAGGRVYLSKDSRLRPDLLPQMYPDLAGWQAVRRRLDPEGRLCSDLSRRVWTLCDEESEPAVRS
jgi:decaprenylphospho-beta-D-ribofuranose 2-oxidase